MNQRISRNKEDNAAEGLCGVQAQRSVCDRLLRRCGHIVFRHKNRRWSEPMLSVLGIGEKNLPKVYESYQAVGTLKKSAADKLGLNENVK